MLQVGVAGPLNFFFYFFFKSSPLTNFFLCPGPRGKLIEALVIPRTIPEPYYTEAFLLCRAYFISSRALLNRLIHFFLYIIHFQMQYFPAQHSQIVHVTVCLCRHYQEPNGAKEDPADVNKLQKPIQGRVLNVLQKWVENSFYDFAEDPVLLERLVRFVADNIPTNMFAHKLIKGVRKKVLPRIRFLCEKKKIFKERRACSEKPNDD